MIEKIHQKLSDSKVARWSVLALAAFTMLCGYFLTDVMAPLKPMLEEQLNWTSTEYGWFTSAYGWFNVFLFMLIIGGIVLDKMGVRFTGVASCILMIIGCSIKYYAISDAFTMEGELFGWKAQVMVAALGYAIFGVGVETAGITVSKIIVRWFKGKEMALAMGLEMATARLGTALALSITVPAAKYFGSISAPILLCLCMLCIGLIAFLVFCVMDRKLDASMDAIEQAEEEEPFRLKDILLIVTNKGFWLIALLCVLFYSAVFPFLKYATDLMVNKYNVDPELAGNIPAILPFGTILLTPFFGNLYDRKGKGATIMIYGALMLIGVHLLFTLPILNQWWFATIVMIVLGIAFSLVPSAMWPSVPKIIPEKQLGTAYALIFWVQNIGLSMVPLLIGWKMTGQLAGLGIMLVGVALLLAVLALFLSYSMLGVCDLSTDGCFTLGATVGAAVAIAGHPYLSIPAAKLCGMLSGFVTAVLQTKMGVNSLLSGIIVNTALYSMNIAVMGGSSVLNMNKTQSVFSDMKDLLAGSALSGEYKLVVAGIAVVLVCVFLGFFLKTRLGLAIRATGNNPDMVRSSSINPSFTTIIGLCVANALTALSGCLLAQSQKSVNIDIGSGMVTIALASLLIGHVFLGRKKLPLRIFGMVLGAFLFRLVYTIALRFDMPAFMLKFVSAVVVIAAISIPYLKDQLPMLRRRAAHNRGRRA